jgi:uncharacterized protein (TIGR02757 family)
LNQKQLKDFLETHVSRINTADFIANDPISIPKEYSKLQDIEISAFWTAMLSWGQRVTIINKCNELFKLMDNAPYDFIKNHEEKDRRRFSDFKHRTFQYTDTLYFLEFLNWYYNSNDSLEDAFLNGDDTESRLTNFNQLFFGLENSPKRTQKHIASPAKNSTCKRLNMFLRWMVRKDDSSVDFGLWNKFSTANLMIPLDVHVERVARKLGLLKRKQRDWKSVVELTNNLKKFDPTDPIKYDYALFGLGIQGEF